MSTLEEQIRAIADEAFAQTEPVLSALRTPGDLDARRRSGRRARLLAVAAAVLALALVGGLLAVTNRSADPVPADEPAMTIGAPMVRTFDGVPLTDVAVSPDATRIAAARSTDEVCIISTSPEAPADADRCYPFPTGVAQGSMTWSPGATSVVFHHDLYRLGQEPDLVQLDLPSGELTVLTDDEVPRGGDDGDTDVAPTFGADGTLHFFRIDTSGDEVQSALFEYGGDGVVTATGSVFAGGPGVLGRRVDDNSIVTTFAAGPDGATQLVSVDTDGGPSRSIRIDGPSPAVAGAAWGRALLVMPDNSGSLQLSMADFDAGEISRIEVPPLESSMRVTGAGLSPGGTRIAIIVADQSNPDGHQLLVADIADDSTADEFTVLATGPEFAPNDGDQAIRPAGIGLLGEIVWTDESLIYSLGPDQIVTLPLR
jgi:hypothetical protein